MRVLVLLASAIGIFYRNLRFADSAKPFDRPRLAEHSMPSLACAPRLLWGKLLHQLFQQLVALGKMGVVQIGDRPEPLGFCRIRLGWLGFGERFLLGV